MKLHRDLKASQKTVCFMLDCLHLGEELEIASNLNKYTLEFTPREDEVAMVQEELDITTARVTEILSETVLTYPHPNRKQCMKEYGPRAVLIEKRQSYFCARRLYAHLPPATREFSLRRHADELAKSYCQYHSARKRAGEMGERYGRSLCPQRAPA